VVRLQAFELEPLRRRVVGPHGRCSLLRGERVAGLVERRLAHGQRTGPLGRLRLLFLEGGLPANELLANGLERRPSGLELRLARLHGVETLGQVQRVAVVRRATPDELVTAGRESVILGAERRALAFELGLPRLERTNPVRRLDVLPLEERLATGQLCTQLRELRLAGERACRELVARRLERRPPRFEVGLARLHAGQTLDEFDLVALLDRPRADELLSESGQLALLGELPRGELVAARGQGLLLCAKRGALAPELRLAGAKLGEPRLQRGTILLETQALGRETLALGCQLGPLGGETLLERCERGALLLEPALLLLQPGPGRGELGHPPGDRGLGPRLPLRVPGDGPGELLLPLDDLLHPEGDRIPRFLARRPLPVRRAGHPALHVEHHRLVAHDLERLGEPGLVVPPRRPPRLLGRDGLELNGLRVAPHERNVGSERRFP
jgi:hypothetical protein